MLYSVPVTCICFQFHFLQLHKLTVLFVSCGIVDKPDLICNCSTLQGVVYDLIECVIGFLDSQGLGHVPVYYVSPVAKSSLAYANIYAEW